MLEEAKITNTNQLNLLFFVSKTLQSGLKKTLKKYIKC